MDLRRLITKEENSDVKESIGVDDNSTIGSVKLCEEIDQGISTIISLFRFLCDRWYHKHCY